MTWTTAEMQEEFNVLGFAAGFCVVQRKADKVKGSLSFGRFPDGEGGYVRRYFDWVEDK